MNGPLIFTIIHIIKALKCIEQENVKVNDAKLEKELNSTDEDAFNQELPEFLKNVKQKCTCPCNAAPHLPVCGKTTNGLMKTFNSQCHLICHNQCGSSERYAIIFNGECPLVPAGNRKNVYSNSILDNRRADFIINPYTGLISASNFHENRNPYLVTNSYNSFFAQPNVYEIRKPDLNSYTAPMTESEFYVHRKPEGTVTTYTELVPSPSTYDFQGADLTSGSFSSIITPLDSCDCTFCPETRWIRLDYYPICGERNGQKRTFESWCHFDCENKCVRHTGNSYLYMHKGPCAPENGEEVVISRAFSVENTESCSTCSTQCKNYFEPVCSKNNKNEYLSFKSRCHMRCHNQCHYQDTKENFIAVYDGHCTWL